MKMERGILVDIGGGSTELVLFEQGSILHLSSFPIGSLNLYQNHVSGVFPDKEERLAIKSISAGSLKNYVGVRRMMLR